MNNLFIVGAQRSGSTYLYRLLEDHPEVIMSQPIAPEPKFFINPQLYSEGKEYYLNRYFTSIKQAAKYFGEKSTSYLEIPKAGRLIKSFFPQAKILIILRDPVIRAYSNYRFSVCHGLENKTFLEALALEQDRAANASFETSVSPYAYRERGYYVRFIREYLELFNANQICILIFEELVGDLKKVQKLYTWLGIDPNHQPYSLMGIVNPAETPIENQSNAFYDLAMGYRTSVLELESLLQRSIEPWNFHHELILNA
jgi:hypothetical protein